MNYSIKQISEITALSADTLRYYEKEGIITAKRHENGYRYYDESDINVLKYVVVLKYAGFTINELKRMAKPLDFAPDGDCVEEVKGILTAKIKELNQAISNYHKIVKLMEESFKMVEIADSCGSDGTELDGFISQIFDDIRSGTLFIKEEL